MAHQKHPEFDALPLDKTGPHGNAWGLWGPDDQLGTLNHLVDERVSQAARECIQTGLRVSLKCVSNATKTPRRLALTECSWSMTGASYPRLTRRNLELQLINKAPLKHAHDDEVGQASPFELYMTDIVHHSGLLIRSAAHNGMASDTMLIKMKQSVTSLIRSSMRELIGF